MKRLRQGDRSVINTLIEANVQLALKLAGNAAHRETWDKSKYTTPIDVLAAALLGLVKAASRLKPKPGYDSIASHAADYIAREISDELTARPEGKKQTDSPDYQLSVFEDMYGSDLDEALNLTDDSMSWNVAR